MHVRTRKDVKLVKKLDGIVDDTELVNGLVFDKKVMTSSFISAKLLARILELKQRNHVEHCPDILYAVSIKEDMAYMCPRLHSAFTKRRLIRRILKKPIHRIGLQVIEYSGI
ncbi:hypothetical protein Tco_0695109 [Tanacetum coccineum]